MIAILHGYFDTMVSMLNADFIVVPVCSAVIASLTFLIIGIIKGRG